MNDLLSPSWILIPAGLFLTWAVLRFVADRYPRRALVLIELATFMTWSSWLSRWPVGLDASKEPSNWWRTLMRWAGIPQTQVDQVAGLVLSIPVLVVLFAVFVSCNRRNVMREIPVVVVGEFAEAPRTSTGACSGDAAIAANVIASRVAQCTRLSRLPTPVPGSPAATDLLPGETALLPRSYWSVVTCYIFRLLTPVRCWDVTGTVVRDGENRIVTATVTDRSLRRPVLTLKREGKCLRTAAEDLAYAIAAETLNRATVVSDWSAWHQADGTGLACYRRALKILKEPTPPSELRDHAQKELENAARLEPANLLVRTELAKLRELEAGDCLDQRGGLDALELYLRVAADYPHALQSVYRVAVACLSFSAKKLSCCPSGANKAQCRRLGHLWYQVSGIPLQKRKQRPCNNGEDPEKCVYSKEAALLARRILRQTRRRLSRPCRIVRWLLPGAEDPALMPKGRQAWQFRQTVRISLCCLNVTNLDFTGASQRLSSWRQARLESRVRRITRSPRFRRYPAPVRPLERMRVRLIDALHTAWVTFLDRAGVSPVGWQAHYNAACFYSLLLAQKSPKGSPADESTDRLAWTSLEHLRRAVYGSGGALPITSRWLRSQDPDLQAIRQYKRDLETHVDTEPYWDAWLSWMTSLAEARQDAG